VLAAGSASLHAAMLGQAAGMVTAGLLAAMVLACLYCAAELWRAGSDTVWTVVALMNLAMIAVHLPAPTHHHTNGTGAAAVDLMAPATAVALTEVLVATAVLCLRSRGRLAPLSGTPDH